jgi:tRNA threonylcarbamoyladenosine biosynthesis protein TsaE
VREIKTSSVTETEQFAEEFAKELKPGTVLAFFGGMGVGKTAFTRGLARGLGITAAVASPTFAIVNDYGGNPPLAHFDMYRIETWEDLYSTGFFDYIDAGYILAVEWSENIENALPEDSIKVTISRGENENDRLITIEEGI